MAYIEMKNSTKLYHMGSTTITANDNVSFTIEQGELAIILGASGAGKSTVLNILGGMDTNTSGQVIIDGKDISNYTPKQLTAYRRTDIGFVFQFYNLVQNLTALENVELASEICRDPLDPKATLESVGLGERLKNGLLNISGVTVYGAGYRGGTVLFNIGGISSERVGEMLDAEGICVRCGYHCCPLGHRLLGTGKGGAVRASFSVLNTVRDADSLLRAVKNIAAEKRIIIHP